MAHKKKQQPNRALLFVNISHFLNHVIMLIYPTVALTLVDVWGVSYGELFKLFFMASLLYGLAALPAGWLGDCWSSRGMLAVYLFGTGTATFLTGFADNPMQISVGLAFTGIFAAIYHPVGTTFVVQHAVDRAKDLGFNGAFGTIGLAAAAFIAASLTHMFGWRFAFFIPGLACFLLGVFFVLQTHEPVREIVNEVTGGSEKIIKKSTIFFALGLMAITALSVGLITQAYTSGLPKIFNDTMKEVVAIFTLDSKGGLTLSSALVTLVILFGALGQILGGSLASKYSPKAVYIGMFILMVPLATVASQLDGLSLVIVAAVMMIVITGCLPAENCIIVRFCPENFRARVFSAKFVMALGGGSFAVLAVGEIFERATGFLFFYGFLIALAFIVIIFAFFLPSMANSQENSSIISQNSKQPS
tara:strand:- start:5739 stop:6992 length:1254 start_codon:yes stop_codon:yes gene_type:complete